MANKKQLAIIKKGVAAWNEWREKNRQVEIDLSQGDLSGTDLRGAHLNRANLIEADLIEADLSRAALVAADLRVADLSGADLSRADLTGAHLSEAHLSGAHLNRATLIQAHLSRAHLSRAALVAADLRVADLSGADLRAADLRVAYLIRADLNDADFREVTLGHTVFADNDLGAVKGLESVKHVFPSTISIDTIYKSKGNIPEVFLRGCGVPENFITFMHSLTGKAFDFYSCFISHSAKDRRFVERLHKDLQAKGVRAWYFPEDAKSGETVWGEIDRGIKNYDKLVVVCSKNSLQSEPVIREIERALNREAENRKKSKKPKGVLFPITLDRYIFDTWEHELKADLLRKVIGDFTGSSRSVPKYTKAFDKLLKDLQKE